MYLATANYLSICLSIIMTKASIQALYVLRFKDHCNTAIAMKNKYENIHGIAFEVGFILTQHKLQSLMDLLQHATKVVRPGRPFLNRLYTLQNVGSHPAHHV